MKQPKPTEIINNIKQRLKKIQTSELKESFIITLNYEQVRVGFVIGILTCAIILMIFSYFWHGWNLYLGIPVLIIISEFLGKWRNNYKGVII
jgi:hypothetical protein